MIKHDILFIYRNTQTITTTAKPNTHTHKTQNSKLKSMARSVDVLVYTCNGKKASVVSLNYNSNGQLFRDMINIIQGAELDNTNVIPRRIILPGSFILLYSINNAFPKQSLVPHGLTSRQIYGNVVVCREVDGVVVDCSDDVYMDTIFTQRIQRLKQFAKSGF